MLGLQFLLACPNWDDPQDKQVQIMYQQDPEAFDRKARLWAQNHAHPSDTIEWTIEHIPAPPPESTSTKTRPSVGDDDNSDGIQPMSMDQSLRRNSSSTTLPVLGSFRMSTKKDKTAEERNAQNDNRLCGGSFCPVS